MILLMCKGWDSLTGAASLHAFHLWVAFQGWWAAAGSQNLGQEQGRLRLCVLPIVRGCRSTSELHPVCCIRGLVFPTSRDCPCVQPAFILSWYSYTLRKTLCCGKESPKLTSRANHQRWNAYDDQCLDGPLLPRKELCWRTELSIELRQPLFNLSLNIILTFSACLSPSSWCVLLTAVVLPVWVGMLPLLLCLSTHAVLPCIGGVMATVHKVFDGW